MRKTTTGVTAQAKRALSAAAVAGVAGLSLSPGLAQAEEAAITTALVTEVSPLQVTGAENELSSPKQPQSLLDTPQTISVVPAKVIRQQGATTLRDVLRNVPGISIQAGEGGTPNGDQLTLRRSGRAWSAPSPRWSFYAWYPLVSGVALHTGPKFEIESRS